MRLVMDEAIKIDAAAMILVVKKMEPSLPSDRLNLRLKKYVTQDLSSQYDVNTLMMALTARRGQMRMSLSRIG